MSDTLYGEGRPYPNLAHSIFGFRFSKYRNEISLKGWGTNTHYENMVFFDIRWSSILVKDNSWAGFFFVLRTELSNLNRLVRRG